MTEGTSDAPGAASRRSPWRVHVAELRRRVGEVRDVSVEGELADSVVGPSRVAEAPVRASLTLESHSGGVDVRGVVRAGWVGECRRCLAPMRGEVEVTVDEVFEDSATEGETYPIDGDTIDLEPMVREGVLLALPLAPLCRPDCAGPDPDHFPVTVESDEVAPDPRWAALDALRDE